MKKILSLILACVMCFSVMSISAFADTQTSDSLFGVITDADGNVVEYLNMPRDIYVNEIRTIPAGGKLTTFQYEPIDNVYFGFTNTDFDNNIITNPACEFKIQLQASKTVGSDGKVDVVSKNVGSEGSYVNTNAMPLYKYYNAVITNLSSTAAEIRYYVLLNSTVQEVNDVINNN